MEISAKYLKQWVDVPGAIDHLMLGGLEVESVEPAGACIDKIVVGEIVAVSAHPNADKLRCCQVKVSETETLPIVTNLTWVEKGMRLPVALVGAQLPDGMKITSAKLRGETSEGMFCGSETLGLPEDYPDVLLFADDVKIGSLVWQVLGLDDEIIDLSITPNRGDCLSYRGVARQLAAKAGTDYSDPQMPEVAVTDLAKQNKIKLEAADFCPSLMTRRIDQINPATKTPLWMQEFLRRSGVRSINVVVDCLNTVMLELGQPMHAYDASKISGDLTARYAKSGESITLLNEQVLQLTTEDGVIADDKNVLAFAGVMGGLDSSVGDATTSVILEAAYFSPIIIARMARRANLSSDSAYRFERGVDYNIAEQALNRAAELITQIAGGIIGNIIQAQDAAKLPAQPEINLRKNRIKQILGYEIPAEQVEIILQRLGFIDIKTNENGWSFVVPSYRPDIIEEIDIIEELMICYGIEKVPDVPLVHHGLPREDITPAIESNWHHVIDWLVGAGYQETISYSFIHPDAAALFSGSKEIPSESDKSDKSNANDTNLFRLKNPISEELSVMRPSLLPGLLRSVAFNLNHQQSRVKVFELGRCFFPSLDAKTISNELTCLSAVITGSRNLRNWSSDKSVVDFYDIKSDVDNCLRSFGLSAGDYYYESVCSSDVCALSGSNSGMAGFVFAGHPGRSALIRGANGDFWGFVAECHPRVLEKFDIEQPVYLFELTLDYIAVAEKRYFRTFSEFPSVSRDLSLLLDLTQEISPILEKILVISGDLLDNVHVFDVYQGEGVPAGKQSVSFSLRFQAKDRTLTEDEISPIMDQVVTELNKEYNAEMRS